ncbi:hypothetical protein LBMAG21_00660 [Armatimonadota bacterium]|nr:hypothetical protein LBMAG21_00660 [Armatimonadota bacterium]
MVSQENGWYVQLLGTLTATRRDCQISHFRTQKIGLLLAYLVYYPTRRHSREELIEILWQEVDPSTGRNRFKQTLASLRRHLEASGAPSDQLLWTDRTYIHLHPNSVMTDVLDFTAHLRLANQNTETEGKISLLKQAVELYGGDLLPGFYEDWVVRERERLRHTCITALQELIALLRETQAQKSAIEFARHLITLDPLEEQSHCTLVRLYIETGHRVEALRHYHETERILREGLGTTPSPELRLLVEPLLHDSPASPIRKREHKPTLKGKESYLGNLSLPLTRFFGREAEIAKLKSLLCTENTLHASRLVTLTGPGGTGKTRLALEAVQQFGDYFTGGVWFVPLADLTKPAQIPNTLLKVLGIRPAPNITPLEQAIEHLYTQGRERESAPSPTLLLLDNFEQLVAGGAAIVKALLERAPSIVCLITSRQHLNIEGEREIALMPLTTPTKIEPPDQLLRIPSVGLFVDRMQSRRSDFVFSEANAPTVVSLCQRLEGIPLAIELTAGWARTLTLSEMLKHLESGFAILSRSNRDAHPRHLSLTATIDWSFRLLSPEVQRFFAQLSLFRGGWTISAAESICEEAQTSQYVELLCNCSLAIAEEVRGVMRFRMLETIRQYAYQKLQESGDYEPLSKRHFQYFLALVSKHQNDDTLPDYNNVLAAIEWCLSESEDVGNALKMHYEASMFWGGYGGWQEGRNYLARLRNRFWERMSQEQKAQALHMEAIITLRQGFTDISKELCYQALEIRKSVGNPHQILASRDLLGVVHLRSGDFETAYSLFEEGLALHIQITPNKAFVAGCYHNMGRVRLAQRDLDAAWELEEKGLSIYRSLDKVGGAGLCLGILGEIATLRGDFALANQLFDESILLFRGNNERPRLAEMLVFKAKVALCQEDWEVAHTLIEEGIPILHELGDRPHCVQALLVAAKLADGEGHYLQAVRLYGAESYLREQIKLSIAFGGDSQSALASLRQRLGEPAFDEAFQAGQRFTFTQAMEYALEKIE